MTLADTRPGPLLTPFTDYLCSATLGMTAIAKAPQAELYHSTMYGVRGEDPTYFLATKDEVLATFGMAKMIKTLVRRKDGAVHTVLCRDGQCNYTLDSAALEDLLGNQIVEQSLLNMAINYAYRMISTLPSDPAGEVKHFAAYDANKVIKRFEDFKRFVNPSQIIPDLDEHVTPITTYSTGCLNNCRYCPEAGAFKPLPAGKVIANYALSREHQDLYHPLIGSGIHESFLNGADLLQLLAHQLFPEKQLPVPGLSPLDIVALDAYLFPDLAKRGAFFGIDTLSKIDLDYLVALNHNRGSIDPGLVGPGKGLTTAYIGIETANEAGSQLVGKNHTYEMKRDASLKVKDARIALKQIYQVGLFGKGFYPTARDAKRKTGFVPTEKLIKDTVKLIAETAPYRVMLSVYQNLEGTRMHKLYDNGQIEPYDDFEAGVRNEIETITAQLRALNRKGLIDWQGQSWPRQNNTVPLENDYEQFVKGRRRALRAA